MRIDFNVLWVEDQQNAVVAQCERVKLIVGKQGFRLQAKFVASVSEAMSCLSNDIYGDHIDLILVDWDLGVGPRGDEGIVQFRRMFPYKDILFYSSYAPDLPQKVANSRLQGIFCSTRDMLPDAVGGVFDTLVKKVLDIDHSRGIVMGATSDIDYSVSKCLASLFDRGDDSRRKKMKDAVLKHMKQKRKDFEKAAAAVEAIATISDLLQQHEVYSSNDRLRLLKTAAEVAGESQTRVDGIGRYISDTVPRRNLLAHLRVKVDGFSRKLIDPRNNQELTSDDMRALRLELIGAQEFFDSFMDSLA